MIAKSTINRFVKEGDTKGIIMAHELDRKSRELEGFGVYNVNGYNLTYNQRERAKELLKEGFSFGLNEKCLEVFGGKL